jgi:hypothetical protein
MGHNPFLAVCPHLSILGKEELMIDQNTLSRFGFLADFPAGILADMAAASRMLSFEPSAVIFHVGEKA